MEYPSLDKPKAGAFRFNTDSSQLEIYDGNQWTGVLATSPEHQTGGTRGLSMGGETPGNLNIVEYANISTTGNFVDFGDTVEAHRAGPFGCSDRTRAMIGGGQNPGYTDAISYHEFASTGNFNDFGNLVNAGREFRSQGGKTRGIIWGQGGPTINLIQYVTIQSTGNAVDFGDTTAATASGASFGSPVRSCYAGGYGEATVQYVTVASLGNAAFFGDIVNPNKIYGTRGVGSATRGLTMAGNQMAPASGVFINTIGYNEIATLGNQLDFGDLSAARGYHGATSSCTRAVTLGGYYPAGTADCEYVQISSTGNAVDFGNLTAARWANAGTSNGHGGL